MNIGVSEHDGPIAVIALQNRVDAFTVPALKERCEELLNKQITRFVVDLRAATFLDSAGLALLVSLLKRAREAGGEVALVQPTGSGPRRILQLTKFDRVFDIEETPERALERLRATA